MSAYEHGNDKTTIANAVAATARSTRFDTRNMPTVVLSISTSGFSGSIVFNASADAGANWTTDNLTYLPRSGMTPTNSTLSYTTETSLKQYLIPDSGEAVSANITRSAGSVTIVAWTIGQTVLELGATTTALAFSDSEGDPATIAAAASDGTSVYGARRDHVHKTNSVFDLLSRTRTSATLNLTLASNTYSDFGASWQAALTVVTGDLVMVRWVGMARKDTGGDAAILIDRGGTKLPGATNTSMAYIGSPYGSWRVTPLEHWDAPTTGTHTYKLQLWNADANTAYAGGGNYAQMVIEVWRPVS